MQPAAVSKSHPGFIPVLLEAFPMASKKEGPTRNQVQYDQVNFKKRLFAIRCFLAQEVSSFTPLERAVHTVHAHAGH